MRTKCVHGFLIDSFTVLLLLCASVAQDDAGMPSIRNLCDGTRNMDSICCTMSRSYGEMTMVILGKPNYAILRK